MRGPEAPVLERETNKGSLAEVAADADGFDRSAPTAQMNRNEKKQLH